MSFLLYRFTLDLQAQYDCMLRSNLTHRCVPTLSKASEPNTLHEISDLVNRWPFLQDFQNNILLCVEV